MDIFKIILYVYAALLIIGGIMGYMKAKSKASLIMGIVSGILILVGVALLNTSLKAGMITVVIVSGLLSIVFWKRFMKTRAFMPAGLLLLLSLAVLILCLIQQLWLG